jgi:hypothetical protein
MPHVAPDVIERTWRSIAALDAPGILRLRKGSGKFQQDLMAFLIVWNSQQRREVAELAVYLGLVILEAFRRGPAKKIKRVNESRIIRLLRKNEEFIAGLSAAPEEASVMLADPEVVPEPAIMEYVVSALAEVSEDPEEDVDLTTEEFWHLVLVLKTFADSLHEASRF